MRSDRVDKSRAPVDQRLGNQEGTRMHRILVLSCLFLAMNIGIAHADSPSGGGGKAVLVTGASTGIGRKVTERLAAHGYVVGLPPIFPTPRLGGMMISEVSDGKAELHGGVQARGGPIGAGAWYDGGSGSQGSRASWERPAQMGQGSEEQRDGGISGSRQAATRRCRGVTVAA